jgi:hypothetical protein
MEKKASGQGSQRLCNLDSLPNNHSVTNTVAVPELFVPFSVAVMMMLLPLNAAPPGTVRITVATPLVVCADKGERVPTVVVKLT